MALSKADLCNGALSHIGSSAEIVDVDNERSKEAQACRRFYDRVRDEVLRDFSWPFAKRTAALTLVEDTSDDDTAEWNFVYRYPSECIAVRRLFMGGQLGRVDAPGSRVEYRIGSDSAGTLIYTDIESAQCEFTIRIDNPEVYPSDFAAAFELLLASKIGPRVAGGDQFKLADRALALYLNRIDRAKANAATEEQAPVASTSDLERARA